MIRAIQIQDAQALQDLCRTSLGHETDPQFLSQRIRILSRDDHYYLAVYENDISHHVQGFIQAEKYDLLYGDSGWNVIALCTAENAQRQGIGTELLSALEKKALEEGYSFIRLNCNTVRTGAHAFYEHLHYVCDKTQKRFIKYIR